MELGRLGLIGLSMMLKICLINLLHDIRILGDKKEGKLYKTKT